MMKETLQTIQLLIDDVKSDVKLLDLTPIVNKVELISQLLEGAIRGIVEKEDATK